MLKLEFRSESAFKPVIYGSRNIPQGTTISYVTPPAYIDDMTKLQFCQTPNPPRTPVFYTLTKIHKPSPAGRPIISRCDGPTERLFTFADKLLQPIEKEQKSYL